MKPASGRTFDTPAIKLKPASKLVSLKSNRFEVDLVVVPFTVAVEELVLVGAEWQWVL